MYDLASAGAGIIDCSCNRYSVLFLLGVCGGVGLGVTLLPAHHSRKNDPPSSSRVSADQSNLVTAVHH